jgi:PTH1 family peptidyl-tRNA hydrolase
MQRNDINLSNIKLIFAIGNPEVEYSNTKHNIGIFFLKEVIKKLELNLVYKKKLNAYISKYKNKKEENIILATSDTYMNNSGICLLQVMNYYKIIAKDVLIFHDDMSLNFLDIAMKFNGSSHGHNGIKDITQKLNTSRFYRLKIGISKPKYKTDNINHVLGKFSKEEKEKIIKKIDSIFSNISHLNLFSIIGDLKI